jgi:uncharacterized membrane protein YedE/YeeE
MIEIIRQPWPWYVSGLLIAAIMVSLILFGKTFGFSSNLRTICSMAGAGKRVKFFDFNWKAQSWNLLFLAGAVIGGYIAKNYLSNPADLTLSLATIKDIQALGFTFNGQLNPDELYSLTALQQPKTIIILLAGGLMVGFGTRYAGGCTSGHSISGIANLQVPSLIATTGFFIGGLIMTYFFMPLIF